MTNGYRDDGVRSPYPGASDERGCYGLSILMAATW
jgi:hypothetical protein